MRTMAHASSALHEQALEELVGEKQAWQGLIWGLKVLKMKVYLLVSAPQPLYTSSVNIKK
jgi:hypothetical protein